MKQLNEYQRLIGGGLFEKMPKAVIAAIAVSYLLNHQGVDKLDIDNALLEEWDNLHKQGIVLQKPAIKQ